MAQNIQDASSSISSSNSTPKWNFHVFLSFRGEDTRQGFTDHLYAALRRKGLKPFRDNEELERGEVIPQELHKAIEDSLFAIVVISKNYASSSWCLDELQKILASRNELGQQVLPIFYHVDPSDVRYQRGNFAEAFAKHEEKFKDDPDKVQKWRDSLAEVTNLSGWDSKNWNEAQLIENVVQVIWSKLHLKLPRYNGTLVGIGSRLDEIDSLLGIGLDDIRFIGIWGMGGIGKTTLASVVYERFRLQNQFEICCFLSNVRELSERYDSQIHLQTQLLSHFELKGMVIENTYQGKNIILNLFCNKKVLLVLDDVSSIIQLENLAESKEWFGAGSRVIITTRNVQLLKSHGVDHIYEAEILSKEESLRLFSNKAFRTDQPKEGYLDLAKCMVKYSGGLPLALEVLGSFLFGRSTLEWEDALDKLKKVPNNDIIKILRISYEGLDNEERAIFLDIACFFRGWEKNEVMQILINCGLHARVGIQVLIERSLLINGMHLDMHDLIQEMGRNIVFQECPNNAGKRSRLWFMKDIDHILKRNMGTELVQGMVSSTSYEACWNPEAFSRMCNLRLFIMSSYINLPHGLKCLSSTLNVLHWRHYPLDTLPSDAQLHELVDLKMHESKLKLLWNKCQCSENLKFLDLSHSKYLIKTPNFSELPNLEKLELEGCEDIVELHPSLGQLKKLQVLNLKGCKNLKALPEKLEMTSLKQFVLEDTGIEELPASLGFFISVEVINLRSCKSLKALPLKLEMTSLEELVLCGCIQVRNLPEFGETMKNLVILDLEETSLVKLPESIGLLTSLETLKLKGCKNLICLPQSIRNLKHVVFIDVSDCSNFSRLPENMTEFKALKKLDASGTAIVEVPASLGFCTSVEVLRLRGCTNLKVLPTKLEMISLKEFVLCGCIQVRNLPIFGENMKDLVILDVGGTNIVKLPESIGLLTGLETLKLRGCKNLICLPQSIHNLKRLVLLDICGCSKFSRSPENVNEIEALENLDADGTAITEEPSSVGNLKKLKTMSFGGCKRSMPFGIFSRHSFHKGLALPASIFNLKSLKKLNLSYCNVDDGSIPDDLSGLSSLEGLDLSGNMFVNLPANYISSLPKLGFLGLNSCSRLESLPWCSPKLHTMDAGECASLKNLSNKQLLRFLASIFQDLKNRLFFGVTIVGSEIPSWFENQNDLFLDENGNASMMIDIPPCEEWLEVALCTVLEHDMFYYAEAKRQSRYSPVWRLPTSVGRLRFMEREIKSPHLWILLLPIMEEDGQMRLVFESHSNPLELDGQVSIRCAWRLIRKGDLEKWGNSENTMCSKIEEQQEEQGQCNLILRESYQPLVNKCETMSPETSLSCLEEGTLDDSWMRFITEDASHRGSALPIANPATAMLPTTIQSTSLSNYYQPQLSESATTEEARICTHDSIVGSRVPISVAKQNPSRKINLDGETSVDSTVSEAYKPEYSERTSAEEIFEELSQVSDLEETELLQIYDILTTDERKYESFKALPTQLRKRWVLMQIKQCHG